MKSTSPPAPVTASPVATPGVEVRSADSGREPRPAQVRDQGVGVDVDGASVPESSATATLRRTFARPRSSCRTPASRVYSAAIMPSATSEKSTSDGSRPAFSTCRGSRWSRAMATFSASV